MGALTPQERAWIVESVVSSQALAGVAVSREEAARLLDEAEGGPVPAIGGAGAMGAGDELIAEAAATERALLLEFCAERYFSARWQRLGALVARARARKLRRFARLVGPGHGYCERGAT